MADQYIRGVSSVVGIMFILLLSISMAALSASVIFEFNQPSENPSASVSVEEYPNSSVKNLLRAVEMSNADYIDIKSENVTNKRLDSVGDSVSIQDGATYSVVATKGDSQTLLDRFSVDNSFDSSGETNKSSCASEYSGGKQQISGLECNVIIKKSSSISDGVSGLNGYLDIRNNVFTDKIHNISGLVDIGRNADVDGRIEDIGESLDINQNSDIEGTVSNVSSYLKSGRNTKIQDDISDVGGYVKLGKNADIDGKLYNVTGDVTIGQGSDIEGTISNVTGDVILRKNVQAQVSNVQGNVICYNSANANGECDINRNGN